jgi:bifunctional ADP-heptose synthase (sugar kinase/adenylyltransferase)
MDFDKLFEQFSAIKAGVIGDVMLDTYWWGHVERISPEAPVPVVALDKREVRIGGAGNVALNLVSLGAKTSIFSVIGEDEPVRSSTRCSWTVVSIPLTLFAAVRARPPIKRG